MTFEWKKAANAIGLASLLLLSACSGAKKEDGAATAATEAPKTEFNIGWSIYAGWMPWAYADKSGILKKWADKYGIKINLIQVNDYVESLNQYTASWMGSAPPTWMR